MARLGYSNIFEEPYGAWGDVKLYPWLKELGKEYISPCRCGQYCRLPPLEDVRNDSYIQFRPDSHNRGENQAEGNENT